MLTHPTREPTFMIVGGLKCGTTPLYEYLRAHPHVFLPPLKEPHFFAEDVGRHRCVFTRAEYNNLFAAARPQHQAVGEASASYLHSTDALPRIRRELPDTKLLVMLRQPAEMLTALHSDLVWICFEDEPDFERAWGLQAERQAGRSLSRLCQVPWFLQYRQLGQLGRQARRLLEIFPREQVQFFLRDDLQDSPEQVYHQALEFIGVAPDGRGEFPAAHAGKRNRLQWLARLQSSLVQSLPRSCIDAGKWIGLGKLNQALWSMNCEPRQPPPLRPEFRRQLTAEFHDDICDLEDLLGRNLDHWKC